MTDADRRTTAAVRRSRWPGWIWAVPIAALAIVGWLAFRQFVRYGPEITITFPAAAGIKAEDTKVRYKGLNVGTVEKVVLGDDRSNVVVTAQMQESVEDLLRARTRFWLVGADIGLADLSELKTLISGPYIEMDPGGGEPRRQFEGLRGAPAVRADEEGTRFMLRAERLGSVGAGTPISYLGLEVGTVDEVRLGDDGEGFRIDGFVRAPYGRLVRDSSRFWTASPIRFSAGASGFEARIGPPESLLSGMISFDTPDAATAAPPSEPGHEFELYASREAAMAAPLGNGHRYRLSFAGAVGGIKVGSPVKLRGFTVGRVVEVRLRYLEDGALETPVTIELDPARLGIEAGEEADAERVDAAALNRALRSLIDEGLRARLERDPPLIGQKHVVLEFDDSAEPATLEMAGAHPSIPTAAPASLASLTSSARAAVDDIREMDLPAVAADLHDTIRRIEAIASSRKLQEGLTNLSEALANIEKLTAAAEGEVAPTMDSIREAAAAARSALASAADVFGGAVGAGDRSLPAALEEVAAAARAIRILASYLERHPEALLQGRDR